MTQARQHGFTLLEVMVSFAILAVVTTMMTLSISANMEKAADAIDQRELREIADTMFGKILFEQTEHRDGDTGSIAEEYGRKFAGLPQARADRYSMYGWRLKKTEVLAAGQAAKGEDTESLFGDASDDETTSTGSSSGTPTEQQSQGSVKLVRFTLTIYHQDNPDAALATLTRYLPPPDFQAGTGAPR